MENTNQSVENSNHKWLIKFVFVLFGVIVLVGVLFLLKNPIVNFFDGVDEQVKESSLVISYSEGFTSLNPLNYEVRNRNFIGNIYEGLTRFDKNLAVESALAVSWGKIDDETWEFTLRDFVYFHDGTTLDAEDVVASIEKAMTDENSQLQSLLSSIESVSAVSDKTIQIVTDGIDPILPNRLVHVYIFPSEIEDAASNIIGTGPYYAVSIEDGGMTLKKFPYYWGFEPVYDDVKLVFGSFDDADVFVNVPIESVETMKQSGYIIQTQPNLDINFILFNVLYGGIFADPDLREAFFMAIDKEDLISSLGGYASAIDQFSAKGVNGYNSQVNDIAYDPVDAKSVFDEHQVVGFSIYMVSDMEELGDFLMQQFAEIEVNVNVEYLDVGSFQDGVMNSDFDVYFMGWKFDLGDVADLYEAVFHTRTDLYGAYNGGYSNSEVDSLIEEAGSEDNASDRLSILKEVASILIDDFAGVPLFESQAIYGFKDGVSWSPRVDGYLWAFDIE